jgi:hypothetical protein
MKTKTNESPAVRSKIDDVNAAFTGRRAPTEIRMALFYSLL